MAAVGGLRSAMRPLEGALIVQNGRFEAPLACRMESETYEMHATLMRLSCMRRHGVSSHQGVQAAPYGGWHIMSSDLGEMPGTEVPVMEILHEFRSLAGIRGRNAHRAQQPPQYDTRVS